MKSKFWDWGVARQAGFSLVELMVVVAIIAILATIGLPRFRVYQAKGRQAEAKNNLLQIWALQQAYYGENDDYASAITVARSNCPDNPLGFYIEPCDGEKGPRYTYEITQPGGPGTFTARASSGSGPENLVLRGCPADVWEINENKELKNISDVTRVRCSGGG